MEATLFPDYSSFDFLQDQQHTERVMAALEKICLLFLGTNPERRAVIRRLERQKTHSIGGLLQLHRGEVSEWPGVGSVFLTIFDEMREEVHADPEGIVTKWINERAPLTFPKDLNQLHPFEITDNQLIANSESTTAHQINENAHSFLTPTSTEEDCFHGNHPPATNTHSRFSRDSAPLLFRRTFAGGDRQHSSPSLCRRCHP